MQFIVCPHCRSVKFLDKEGKDLWVALGSHEEFALDIIVESPYLLLLVGGYEELEECCKECCLTELN